jgi:hypothetical protein
MRGPIWRFSLFVCVAAAFAQCASARQQLQDVAASPAHKEALAARKNAAGNHESRYRAPLPVRPRGGLLGWKRKLLPPVRFPSPALLRTRAKTVLLRCIIAERMNVLPYMSDVPCAIS